MQDVPLLRSLEEYGCLTAAAVVKSRRWGRHDLRCMSYKAVLEWDEMAPEEPRFSQWLLQGLVKGNRHAQVRSTFQLRPKSMAMPGARSTLQDVLERQREILARNPI